MGLSTIEGGLRSDRVIEDALAHAAPGFALGQRLQQLHGDLAMIEGVSPLFDIEAFARDGNCAVEARRDMYHQLDTEWLPPLGLVRRPRIALLDVAWQSSSFQVVLFEWGGSLGAQSRHYILGRDRDRCHAFLEAVCRWSHDVRGEILVFNEGCFHKSVKLYDAVMSTTFDQLVLEGDFKQQIRDDFTQFLASRDTYEEFGVPWRRGALFIGPPGNGKTLCVKALVHLLGIPCLYVQSFDAQYATSQASIEEVFRRARSTAPCVLVLEDLDALLTDGCRSFFLNELDGFATNHGVITIATTNHPERLDASIVDRPSRFDRKYHFDLPAAATRALYVAAWNDRLRPALRLSEAGRAQVVEATHGFSFAYIQELFVSSTMRWMATRDSVGILPVALEQIEALRAQMQSPAPAKTDG
ncbi:MAG: ATP-binding protein [Deltaproteobacteria bacterium]|nr:ATP-binding protein [Deltaproteobacteria bacterium]